MQALTTLVQAVQWLQLRVRGELRIDSRLVQPGDGFIAWPGAASDGRRYVADALARGAGACLVEQNGVEGFSFSGDAVAAYAHLKAATGPLAAAFYGDASRQIDVLAITGTNGKTSTAWWLAQALSHLTQVPAQTCAMVGTLGVGLPPAPGAQGLQAVVPTGLTTPDPVQLQQAFRRFVDEGVTACAIEASSIGLQEHRLAGTHIRTAIFTNFTQDHLDYHVSMAAYWSAKRTLFNWPGLRSAVINIDDAQGATLATELRATLKDVWTVSCRQAARLQATDLGYATQGLQFKVVEGDEAHLLQTTLISEYNVANLLGVVAAMRSLGVPLAAAVDVCSRLSPVPGRMECISETGGPLVAVDYAHTPDALDQALRALRPLAQQRGGQLWCVFGCGGDRDAGKRPLMGAVAAQRADHVVVTSDNPRSESPLAILAQVQAGIPGDQATSEVDRALAIAHAVQAAAPADVLLVAGKGHEDYQDAGGVKRPFSDRAEVRRALQARAAAASMFTLGQAMAWLPGAILVGEPDVVVRRVHTDTRSLAAGDLFVALKGERFDAHDFLAEARAAGAVAAISHSADALVQAGLPGWVVADTRLALGQLAQAWRAQFSLPLIAVTGSNGKTTVTQMLASILRAFRGEAALATQGNLNNDIGVPLTLLRLRASHRIGVIELGMNHPGEIAYLAAMTQATVALVNNAQREHLEFMGSVDAVARENGSVISALAGTGAAVFPASEAHTPVWAELAGNRLVMTFAETGSLAQAPATGQTTGVVGQAQWAHGAWQVQVYTPAGNTGFRLNIAGRHNVRNALAATACALSAGVPLSDIARGLEVFEPVKGRSRTLLLSSQGRELTLVDDSYNANPDSVRAAIEVLTELPGPRLLVLGDMGEVGNQGPEFHAEAGAYARAQGIETLYCLGAQARLAAQAFGDARHFDDMDALNAAVLALLPRLASVLVKGSRFMKMERVVQAVQATQTKVAEVADAH